jgi:hypothetical protein
MGKRLKSLLAIVTMLFTIYVSAADVQKQSKEVKSVQNKVEKTTNKSIDEKRTKMMKEAIETIEQTAKALRFLDEDKKKEALDTLAKVSGKIDLIVARDPSLKLLPISVTQKQYDLLVTKDMIKSLLYDATKALKDGRVQEARYMLKNLASEIVITTTSIPLATYPSDIKAVAPLIDEGKIDEAKVALQSILNSLVVTQNVIPLPILRATFLLQEAEKLAQTKKRDDKQIKELDSFLKEASYQLEMAELLGYGTKDQFEEIYKQIDIIKSKTQGNKSGKGWFDTIKEKISKLTK